MYKIKYYSKEKRSKKLLDNLYDITSSIEKDYPNHKKWFYDKFVNELDGKKREIIFGVKDNQIAGVIFLKKEVDEKKICTIFIRENYRKDGLGTLLLQESFKFLKTEQPLISMPDYKEACFKKIIDKYKWKNTQSIKSLYSNNAEIVFNGYLEK